MYAALVSRSVAREGARGVGASDSTAGEGVRTVAGAAVGPAVLQGVRVAGSAAVGPAAGEVFPSLVPRGVAEAEERYLAVFEHGLARLTETVDRAVAQERSWIDLVRAGLVALLGFFDDEPEWGWLLVCEAPVGDGSLALRCEQRVEGVLTGLLDEDPAQAAGALSAVAELTAEFVMGGVFALLRSRLLGGEQAGPLVELAPALMAFIVAPYVGQAAASGELAKLSAPDEVVAQRGVVREEPAGWRVDAAAWARAVEGGARLPIRVTHRTTMVLKAIAAQPGISNREVGRLAGIGDEGQTSKLLARLSERGVIENVSRGADRGKANAWRLTREGERALRLIGDAPLHRPRRMRGSA